MVISNILKPKKWVVSSGLNCDETFLSNLLDIILVLGSDTLLDGLVHSLSCYTDQVDIEIKSKLRLEGNTDCFLRLGIDDALRCIEVEVFVQNLGQSAELFA